MKLIVEFDKQQVSDIILKPVKKLSTDSNEDENTVLYTDHRICLTSSNALPAGSITKQTGLGIKYVDGIRKLESLFAEKLANNENSITYSEIYSELQPLGYTIPYISMMLRLFRDVWYVRFDVKPNRQRSGRLIYNGPDTLEDAATKYQNHERSDEFIKHYISTCNRPTRMPRSYDALKKILASVEKEKPAAHPSNTEDKQSDQK